MSLWKGFFEDDSPSDPSRNGSGDASEPATWILFYRLRPGTAWQIVGFADAAEHFEALRAGLDSNQQANPTKESLVALRLWIDGEPTAAAFEGVKELPIRKAANAQAPRHQDAQPPERSGTEGGPRGS
jgi:hypothetical protein